MLENVKYVMINNEKYDIQGETLNSLEEIKEAAVAIDPSLANADAVIVEDTVQFVFRAGTKGADIRKVIVGTRIYDNDPEENSTPKEIQDALIESGLHPELANATYVVSEDTVTFRFNAGTKG